jgi:acyl-ACP thioesterase
MPGTYKKEFKISSYDLNPRREARLTSMANFFQEMAYLHATQMGYGYEDMKEHNTMWVLSRMRIRMERYPGWDDRILIETWPSGMEKLFAVRNFRVRDHAGEVLGVATTYWLILDMGSRRPVRPKHDMRFVRFIHPEQVFDNPLDKIELDGESKNLDRHQVLYSDLDIIGHVNNVKYMEWCIDTAIQNHEMPLEIREFEINFLQETRLNETILIDGILDPMGESYFVAHRKEDGREVFRARITWGGTEEDQAGNPS